MPTEVFNHTVDQHLNDSMNTQANKDPPPHTHTRPPSSDKANKHTKKTPKNKTYNKPSAYSVWDGILRGIVNRMYV